MLNNSSANVKLPYLTLIMHQYLGKVKRIFAFITAYLLHTCRIILCYLHICAFIIDVNDMQSISWTEEDVFLFLLDNNVIYITIM